MKMLYLKSIFLISFSLLLVPVGVAWWNPGYMGHPGYQNPYAGQPVQSENVRKGMRIEKNRDERGYILSVHLAGIEPSAIETQVSGGHLLLRSAQSAMTRRSGDYGRSYFSHSFTMNRRVRLPYDADAAGMVRNDSENLIEIVLPLRSRY